MPGGHTHCDPFQIRPPVQTGMLLDDDPLLEPDDEDHEDEPLDELNDELQDDEPLDELDVQSHLQQPAPCQ